jgi:hypothetical protein
MKKFTFLMAVLLLSLNTLFAGEPQNENLPEKQVDFT